METGNNETLLDTSTERARPEPVITYQGNNYDLVALAATGLAIASAFVCGTLIYGAYCLPLAPLILGLIGLLNADRAANPARARIQSWIGIGVGGGFFAIMLLVIVTAVLILVSLSGKIPGGNF
ncbi:MAG: hypothetical protein HY023_03515 [Chloroflexi bacterium]|nr:hypothetical protein [Chloroflexota bacterium]